MGTLIDLTGQKFGRQTVIKRNGNISGRAAQLCKCECGTEKTISGKVLRNGHSKSCGCYKEDNPPRLSNLINKKFGKLTVLELMPADFNERNKCGGSRFQKCKCECGNITYVQTSRLNRGEIQSCGKCSCSKGNNKIAEILKNNNINFKQEVKFDTCKFKDTNYYAKFDFYVENNYIIEYDGEQHFQYKSDNGQNNKENFEKTKNHDEYKNQQCKENNIPLIRIPYTHLKDLCIEDLKLETTTFLVE